MEESDKIKTSALIDENLFAKQIKDTAEFERQISNLVVGLKGVISSNAEILKQKSPQDAATIKAQTQALIENEKARKALLQTEVAQQKVEQQLIKNGTEQIKQDRELLKNSQQKQKETDKEAKTQANLNSQYKQMSDRLRDVKKEIKELTVAGKPISIELTKEFRDLDGAIRLADAKVGDFSRNVGNYQGRFNGLGNSVNQLTREMPAFANSVQTGFMALSNNLPIFFDEIKRTNDELKAMQAEGKKAPSLFSSIASSILSWGTALSIGVTLLTVFGKEIVDMISNLGKSDEAFKLSAKAQSTYYDKFKEITDKIIDAQVRRNVAEGKWSEERANRFNAERKQTEQVRDIEKIIYDERVELAAKYNMSVAELLKKRPTTAEELNPGAELSTKDKNIIEARNKELFERNKSINAELLKIENNKNELLRKAAKQTDEEIKADKAEADKKERDKKPKEFQLTDQDKKALDEMENLDKKRMKSEENLKKWTEESQKEQSDNELQTIKTSLDEELDAHNATIDAIDILKQKAAEKEKARLEKQRQDEIKLAQAVTNAFENELDRKNKLRIEAQQKEVDEDKNQINRQLELAKDGKANQLAFEEQQLAKDTLRKRDLEEKAAKQKEALQLVEAYFNALNSELSKPGANASAAPAKALADVLLAKGIAKGLIQFAAEGNDDVQGPGTTKSDSIPFMLSKHEGVVKADANIKNKGVVKALNNDTFDKMFMPKINITNETGGFADNISNGIALQQNKEITYLLKQLIAKPVQQVDVDGIGNLIETMYEKGQKSVTIHKGKTRL